MQPRKTVQEQFSSFAQLEEGQFRGWLTQPHLLKNLDRHRHALSDPQKSTTQAPDSLETGVFWSIYWHALWQAQGHPLAEAHLFAYLQETCFWVASDLKRKISGSSSLAALSLADFFQMAMAELRPTLEKFERSASNNLKAFAASFLACRIKSNLRQQREADFCSAWGLLRKTSQRRLLNALGNAGLSEAEIEQHRLLWMGFNALYVGTQAGGTAQLPEPTPEVWEAIASFYNRQRTSQLTQPAPSLDATQVERNLRKMAQWIHGYFYPPIDSLNAQQFEGEEGGGEKQDFLPASDQASLLEALIETEQNQARLDRQASVQQILSDRFRQFDPQIQQILCLLYGQRLSQQAIMTHTGLSQPAISRRLAKARGQLVEALLNQLESEVNNSPDPDQLKIVGEQLKLCLQIYLRETSLCEGIQG